MSYLARLLTRAANRLGTLIAQHQSPDVAMLLSKQQFGNAVKACAALSFLLFSALPASAQSAIELTAFSGLPENPYSTPQSFGWSFVPNTSILVTQLGHLDDGLDGLGSAHEVGIFNSSNTLLTSAVVPSGIVAPLIGNFRFVNTSPVLLNAGETYTVAGFYSDTADNIIYSQPANLTVAPEITLGIGRFQTSSPSFVAPDTSDSFGQIYVGANFRTGMVVVPETETLALLGFALVPVGVGLVRRRK